MNQGLFYLFGCRCVALVYALFDIHQNTAATLAIRAPQSSNGAKHHSIAHCAMKTKMVIENKLRRSETPWVWRGNIGEKI